MKLTKTLILKNHFRRDSNNGPRIYHNAELRQHLQLQNNLIKTCRLLLALASLTFTQKIILVHQINLLHCLVLAIIVQGFLLIPTHILQIKINYSTIFTS